MSHKGAAAVNILNLSVPLASLVGFAAMIFYVGGFVTDAKRNDDSLREDLNKIRGMVTREIEMLRSEMNAGFDRLGSRVVGKTPEGFHRRDCEDAMRSLYSLNRNLIVPDCYELPGYKAAVAKAASRWVVKVGK